MSHTRPQRALPLIRHLSYLFTPLFIAAKLHPNTVTIIGIVAGFAAFALLSQGDYAMGLMGVGCFFIATLMDHCDGEVARATGKSSAFGAFLDDVADWIVHVTFFLGLGFGAAVSAGDQDFAWVWLSMGVIAAAGATFNSAGAALRSRRRRSRGLPGPPPKTKSYDDLLSTSDRWLFIYREHCRVDFWLIVFVLQVLDVLWVLLPVAALGAQLYWILGFVEQADDFST